MEGEEEDRKYLQEQQMHKTTAGALKTAATAALAMHGSCTNWSGENSATNWRNN